MPTVPRFDTPQVAPAAPSNARFDAPQARNFAPQQAMQMGQAVEGAGLEAGRQLINAQAQANELRVIDALNQVKEAQLRLTYDKDQGYTQIKGINALERPDGKQLHVEYGEQLKKNIGDVEASLGNDIQKQAFRQRAGGILLGFAEQVQKHENQEMQTYTLSVSDGVIATARREMALNPTNFDVVDGAVSRIKAETYRQAKLLSKSAEWQEAQARKMTSDAHRLAVLQALDSGNPEFADGYLKKYAGQMEADDILQVRGHITKQMDAQVASGVATQVVRQVASRLAPTDADRAFNILLGAESGGQQFKDYGYGKRQDGTPKGRGFLGELKRPDGNVSTEISIGVNIGGKEMEIPTLVPTLTKKEVQSLLNGEEPSREIVQKAVDHARMRLSQGKSVFSDPEPLTSPKGAIGIAQVMPGTAPEAAKLAGLPWDENRYRNDLAYNRALGEAYFKKQLQDFGGDLSLAYAAYNAGPGAVRKALKASERPVMTEANADPNAPKQISWLSLMPKETQAYVAKNMAAFQGGQGTPQRPTLADIDAQLQSNPALAGNPQRLKMAREEAARQFELQEKAIKQQGEDATAEAMRQVIGNGGRYTDLPASVRNAIPPKEVDNVLSFASRISKGDDVTSPLLYAKLSGNPAQLAQMSDAQFFMLRRELSEGDFKHFANERAKQLGNAQGANGPGDLNSGAIKQVLDARMRVLGMDPTPKDDGGKDAARVGAIRQFVDQYFINAQRDAGKKFSDAEVTQHVDALFAKNATFRGWFSDSSGPMLSMKPGDIPSDKRDAIKAAFKRRGVDSPTDAQILNAYWTLQVAKR